MRIAKKYLVPRNLNKEKAVQNMVAEMTTNYMLGEEDKNAEIAKKAYCYNILPEVVEQYQKNVQSITNSNL